MGLGGEGGFSNTSPSPSRGGWGIAPLLHLIEAAPDGKGGSVTLLLHHRGEGEVRYVEVPNRGRSGCADLDYLAQRIHLHSYSTDTRIWVEYVESNANWADGTSREGPSCKWAASHGFQVRVVEVPYYT